jgi:alpha-tubulin suppressor-like RCC1 family protein
MVSALSSKNVLDVACGDCHTVALVEDGTVFTWGGCEGKRASEREKESLFLCLSLFLRVSGFT